MAWHSTAQYRRVQAGYVRLSLPLLKRRSTLHTICALLCSAMLTRFATLSSTIRHRSAKRVRIASPYVPLASQQAGKKAKGHRPLSIYRRNDSEKVCTAAIHPVHIHFTSSTKTYPYRHHTSTLYHEKLSSTKSTFLLPCHPLTARRTSSANPPVPHTLTAIAPVIFSHSNPISVSTFGLPGNICTVALGL